MAGKTKDIEDDIPVVIPSTWEEALADIEQSEKDFAEGRCFAWDEVKQTIEECDDAVMVDAFWDMRMHPESLQKRI